MTTCPACGGVESVTEVVEYRAPITGALRYYSGGGGDCEVCRGTGQVTPETAAGWRQAAAAKMLEEEAKR